MTRLEMQEIIKERVPYLIDQHKTEWEKFEKQRQAFVMDYPLERIEEMTLDEYVVGKGSGKKSFCYRVEYDLNKLGIISGAYSTKYGVWYGSYGEGDQDSYQFTKKHGDELNNAFQSVKSAIVELLNNPTNLDKLRKNKISPMFKGKILFLYHPEQFLNIFSKTHLLYFAANLNLMPLSDGELHLQKALMDYKSTWPELTNGSPFLYSTLLYDQFNHPPKKPSQIIPLLSTAVTGVSVSNSIAFAKGTSQKPDYAEQQRNHKMIGERGEKIVLELEKRRLRSAGKKELAEQVRHVSDTDDSQGYDILSFDCDGTERKIEVKSTSMDSFYRGFFLSANELEKSESLDNYYLYLVSSAMTDKPVVCQISKPVFKEPREFTLSPVNYNVRLNNAEIE